MDTDDTDSLKRRRGLKRFFLINAFKKIRFYPRLYKVNP